MLTPQELLQNLIDCIATADQFGDDDSQTIFATERQVKAVNIAIQKIIPGIKKAARIHLIAIISGRNPDLFRSSRDLTLQGANAILHSIYGDAEDLSVAEMNPRTVTAIKHAHTSKEQNVQPDLFAAQAL